MRLSHHKLHLAQLRLSCAAVSFSKKPQLVDGSDPKGGFFTQWQWQIGPVALGATILHVEVRQGRTEALKSLLLLRSRRMRRCMKSRDAVRVLPGTGTAGGGSFSLQPTKVA